MPCRASSSIWPKGCARAAPAERANLLAKGVGRLAGRTVGLFGSSYVVLEDARHRARVRMAKDAKSIGALLATQLGFFALLAVFIAALFLTDLRPLPAAGFTLAAHLAARFFRFALRPAA